MILPLLCFGDIIAAWQHRADFDKRMVARLIPGSIAGVIIGSLLLRWFNHQRQQVAEALVNLDVGFESVVLVGLHWYRLWRARGQLPLFRPHFARTSVVGMFAGLSSTMAHAAGPIIALHLLPQRMHRRVYVGTCAIYFLIVNGAKLPGYVGAGMFTGNVLLNALKFSPLVLVGAVTGVWINKRISDQLFSAVVYALAFATGWYILFKGIAQTIMSLTIVGMQVVGGSGINCGIGNRAEREETVESRGGAVARSAPFPPPAHRTGLAELPHPALGEGSRFRMRQAGRIPLELDQPQGLLQPAAPTPGPHRGLVLAFPPAAKSIPDVRIDLPAGFADRSETEIVGPTVQHLVEFHDHLVFTEATVFAAGHHADLVAHPRDPAGARRAAQHLSPRAGRPMLAKRVPQEVELLGRNLTYLRLGLVHRQL
jgi:hypothetical protein